MPDPIVLKRDVEAVQIPSGQKLSLKKGETVVITQELGGTITVETRIGLARLDSKDNDALGREALKPEESSKDTDQKRSVRERVWDQLKTCYDPEIPVDIVELGLVYECRVQETEDSNYDVSVKMTLTAQGCGMGSVIAGDAKQKIEAIPEVKSVQVDVVWDPPWNPSLMSDEAKAKLGIS